MLPDTTNRTIEAVWKIEAARLIAGLASFTRDVSLAEDLAQEALVAALEQWPASGVPARPGAWLMTVGKRRAVDLIRRNARLVEKHQLLVREIEDRERLGEPEAEVDAGSFGDDMLRLIFIACHPVLSREARAALTLRLLGGLTTEEIARAFLTPVATIAQRIVRAKRTLSEAGVPYEAPSKEDLPERLASVLEVIYLIFNEGYSATAGDDWARPQLCEEAMRLGRVLAALMPEEAEVHGLVALMELHASRLPARVNAAGDAVLLLEQDRSRWDQLLIRRGLEAFHRARTSSSGLGPYGLQAAIGACHATARQAGDTDWEAILALYDALVEVVPTPVVELNRAVAVSMAHGPQPALDLVEELASDPVLQSYYLLPSVRGDLLFKLGLFEEAHSEFERAAAMTQNRREQDVLRVRAAACLKGASA